MWNRGIKCLLLVIVFLVQMIPGFAEKAGKEFVVGEQVYLKGTYTASSDGKGTKYHGKYDLYIIEKINKGARNPYALRPVNKSWIDGWASERDILHDYTDSILTSYLQNYQIDSYYDYVDVGYAYELLDYYTLFNHGAKYDIKREECWNKFFSIPYPGWGKEFYFRGYVMTPEALGNYLYGLTGALWGFNGKLIHQGAGYAQTGTMAYVNRPDLYYGDRQDDYEWIEAAIQDCTTKVTVHLDLADFADLSWLMDAAIQILK